MPSYWSQQAVWIDQAAWVGDVAGGGPFTLGSLMSGNLGICSRQPLDQRPVLMFRVFALVRNVLCNQDLSLKAICLVCPTAEKKQLGSFILTPFSTLQSLFPRPKLKFPGVRTPACWGMPSYLKRKACIFFLVTNNKRITVVSDWFRLSYPLKSP